LSNLTASQSDRAEVVVIGAGIIGCAVAYEITAKGKSPIVLEQGPRIAEGVTSRNSGVIHAGIYYPPKSLKAESCIRGKALLYEWCQKSGVSHRKTGKWIVGTRSEESELGALYDNALASGATGLRWGTSDELCHDVPGLQDLIGVFSEETGIVDPYEYSNSLRVAAEEKGAVFVTNSRVTAIERTSEGYEITTTRGTLLADAVVNAAGLYADEVSEMVGIRKYKIYPWRGDYFRLASKQRYSRLIYPVKKKKAAGLGVHLTLALDGSYRLGPDVEVAASKESFDVPIRLEEKRRLFFEAASKFLPDISIDQLSYADCGIRPKLRSPTDTEEKDFVLSEDLPGFINLIGIESPGLTASRDLAQRASRLL
jgi:L-2-hydroxyglutarate oxidase LhgO